MDTVDWIHMLFVFYFMIGGFLPNPCLYLKISMITIFGWVLFGTCALNLGKGFPNNSITKYFSKEVLDIDQDLGSNIFMIFIATSILMAMYRTGYQNIMYIIGLYLLSRQLVFKKAFYKDSKIVTM